MDISKLGKTIVMVMFASVILVLFGSILDIRLEEWVKISIPKPSVKIEKETSEVESRYFVEGEEVTLQELKAHADKKEKEGEWGQSKMVSENLKGNSKTEVDKNRFEVR